MAGSNFFDGCKKILWGREMMKRKPHISFQSIGIKNILYINISSFLTRHIFKNEILKKERRKPLLEEFDKSSTPGQRFHVKSSQPEKMVNDKCPTNARGDGYAWN